MTTKHIVEASGKDITIVRKVMKEKGVKMKRGRIPVDYPTETTDMILKALAKWEPKKPGRPVTKVTPKVAKTAEKPIAKKAKTKVVKDEEED